ncbi:uncharacterized protein GGS22DRAFT_64973 [Annulohypoxylon maeteangense]|uniref:uncharacterized protein n=1 Tax=Annulohypoxylon maeteangense TaxID=1927788 RepID=UPI0020072B72|nr:uncharacterized protein GGS22DRAFT_64973 [Annulohypoxylon maeteangense]KAI0888926.1 hypothetical protein GGS22DRAFT_64973 [Annulohypoxylon maeteangense]
MDAFLKRTKRKSSALEEESPQLIDENESTDVKLAILSSLYSNISQEALLEALLVHDGSVEAASASLAEDRTGSPKKQSISATIGCQTSLRLFASKPSVEERSVSPKKTRRLSKKGTTLHLYDPEDIAEHTPCSIVHNFLPPDEANALLKEMLDESESFEKITFKLFDNVVQSHHTSSFYVGTEAEINTQKDDYFYNGARLEDIRRITPQLLHVRPKVQEAVNREIQTRIKTRYPEGRKLKYQSSDSWSPNCAFVNCYNGPQQNVGYHTDQLTYLGPRAVIGSLSLGVAREFRVRRIVPKDDNTNSDDSDAEGQISIHLPHNSLLVMHAEMQEEWKHSIAPAQAIDPHPIAGNRRINITYRHYKSAFHPRHTPRCKCNIPAVLRVVQKKKGTQGRYFWMCYGGNVPGKENCSFFQWAEFDDDGNPRWDKSRYKTTPTMISPTT